MYANLLVTAVALPAIFAFTSCKEKETSTEPAPSENKPAAESTPDKPAVIPDPENVTPLEMSDDAVPNVEEPTEAQPGDQ